MSEYEAAIAAGVDVWRWEQRYEVDRVTGEKRGYPQWFKANILAWYKMHALKEVHSSDVVASVQERESKKRRNK